MEQEKITYCADMIAWYQNTGKIVLVERLGAIKGLALPGGKQDPGEMMSQTAEREFFEETGLDLQIDCVFGAYGEAGRDPRGRSVSVVFTGLARGVPRDEPGKTKVVLMDVAEFESMKHLFAFDHAKILEDYLKVFGG